MIAPFESENIPVPGANGSHAAPATPDPPSIEGLLFAAGAISADQLGEVVRDAVLSQRPVAAVAVERGFVTRDALAELLRSSGVDTSVAEALGEVEAAPSEVDVAPSAGAVPLDPYVAQSDVSGFQPIVAAVPQPTPVIQAVEAPLPAISAVVQQAVAAAAQGATPDPAAIEALLPATAHAPQPAPVVSAEFAVSLRLESGERVVFDTADSLESATELARGIVETVATSAEWPFVSGRFIRPGAVESIDIERALGD